MGLAKSIWTILHVHWPNEHYAIYLFLWKVVFRLNDLPVREPIQKRSIEKKTKIVKAGLDLFCEKGFYKTNTVEIAKAAGVSTGTVYSYFKNKTDIYIASFEYFLDSYLRPLLEELETLPKPVDTQVLIDNCRVFDTY